jgi:hypothetical protein
VHVPVSAVFLSGSRGAAAGDAAASRGHWADLKDGFSVVLHSRALLTVLIAWNVAMCTTPPSTSPRRGSPSAPSTQAVRARPDDGLRGIGLAFGAYLAGQWIERRGLARVYGASLG